MYTDKLTILPINGRSSTCIVVYHFPGTAYPFLSYYSKKIHKVFPQGVSKHIQDGLPCLSMLATRWCVYGPHCRSLDNDKDYQHTGLEDAEGRRRTTIIIVMVVWVANIPGTLMRCRIEKICYVN